MKLYKGNKRFNYRNVIISLIVFAGIVAAFLISLRELSANAEDESKISAMNAIKKAIVTCYAVEGFYPPNIQYIEENYGIIIDHDKYVVNYQTLGSNTIPYVELVEAGQG